MAEQNSFYYNVDEATGDAIFCWVDNSQLLLAGADFSVRTEQPKRVFMITELDPSTNKANIEVVRDEGFINETKFQAEFLQFINDLCQMTEGDE